MTRLMTKLVQKHWTGFDSRGGAGDATGAAPNNENPCTGGPESERSYRWPPRSRQPKSSVLRSEPVILSGVERVKGVWSTCNFSGQGGPNCLTLAVIKT